MKRPEEYSAIKERLGRKIVEEAAEFLKPEGIDFFDHVDYINVGTPLTHKHYLNCPEGSIYSADHDLTRKVIKNNLLQLALYTLTKDTPNIEFFSFIKTKN